jgi:hypothetical protein
MTEWLQLQLKEVIAGAVSTCEAVVEVRTMDASAGVFHDKDEYFDKGDCDCVLPLCEECQAKSERILGDEHPDSTNAFSTLAAYPMLLPWPSCSGVRLLLVCIFRKTTRACGFIPPANGRFIAQQSAPSLPSNTMC